jgi:ketosteroid isomerase-like protein
MQSVKFLASFIFIALLVQTTFSATDNPMECTSSADELIAVDKAFNARAQAADVPTAFVEFAAEDAVMYRNGSEPIVGREAIRKVLAPEAAVKLVWEPLTADIAASGDLGYTRGSFTLTLPAAPDGKAPDPIKGYYVSIWKKQADGSWKWVFDSGVISQMPAAPETDN